MDNLDNVNLEILAKLDGQAKEDFRAGLHNLAMADPETKAALRGAFNRLRPNASERELDIMVTGKAPPENKGWL